MARLAERAGTRVVWPIGADVAVTGITADSRAVRPGMVFAALPGGRVDGRDFIGEAVARGAVAVLAPAGTAWPADVEPVPLLIEADPRRLLAAIAVALAGALPRRIVAVTGTNGKTSTVDFLRQIFIHAGLKAASLGTLGLVAEGFPAGASLTTPDPVSLADTLASLKAAWVEHVALEASSHGLDQRRLDGVALAAAGFTNLTRDHLDYHGDMARYRAAKLRLFFEVLPLSAPAVAMADLDGATLEGLRAHRPVLTVGPGGDAIDVRRVTPIPAGQRLEIVVEGVAHTVALSLPGRFQADNALLAVGLARAIGVSGAVDALAGLAPVRGRFELVSVLDHGAGVYVDYAHTPDALARLLAALRPHASGRLLLVFGAGGDRDRGKRALMGAVAARDADLAIVTDDNPRREDPAAIRAEIVAGCPGAIEIGDRGDAIAAGLGMLRPGDVLVVAGKGHEQGQIIGDTVLAFDDAGVIRSLL